MQQAEDSTRVLLSETEVGDMTGFAVRTLQKWRNEGTGPVPCGG